VKGLNPLANLYISKRAHLILPTHRVLDAAYESAMGKNKIGSTLKGIGPCYTDKTARYGIRFGDILSDDFRKKYDMLKERHMKILSMYDFDSSGILLDNRRFDDYEALWFESIEKLRTFKLIDSELYINRALNEGKRILAEGAQGSLLDIDFGSYPYVTSSNTITSGVCSGLGVSPSKIGKVFGVFKAYCTRVGSGPFPTELEDSTGELLRQTGHEFGSTTGRPRRCGWLDLPALKYALMLNGVTDLIMMKSDVMNDLETICICTSYETGGMIESELTFETLSKPVIPVYNELSGWKTGLDQFTAFDSLPNNLLEYIGFIEKQVALPIVMLSTGPGREQTLFRRDIRTS
jgi:adenylosuccinate synthase